MASCELVSYWPYTFHGQCDIFGDGNLDITGDTNLHGSVALGSTDITGDASVSGDFSCTTATVGSDLTAESSFTAKGQLKHQGTTAGFYGSTPISKPSSLTAPNNATINTVTILTDGPNVVTNMRTRLGELESKLRSLGLLA